jgi:hypothetical protein
MFMTLQVSQKKIRIDLEIFIIYRLFKYQRQKPIKI